MYESFYGLKEKPFSMLPDPGFLYLSKKHQKALTLFEYGLMNHAGFCVISGEIGSGKTTLLRKLLQNMNRKITVGMITNTHKGFGNLLDWVLSAYDIHEKGLNDVEKHQRFVDFLVEQYAARKTTLLIVDEAQNMAADKLEELRMLSNINADKDQVLQIILAGQPELKDTLYLPELKQFVQRIAVDYHLDSLDQEDTRGYIMHRLAVAGADHPIFTEAACDMIFKYSGGTPRLINLLCDTAMVYGFADEQAVIDEDLVAEMILERLQSSLVPLASNERPEKKSRPPLATNNTAEAANTDSDKKAGTASDFGGRILQAAAAENVNAADSEQAHAVKAAVDNVPVQIPEPETIVDAAAVAEMAGAEMTGAAAEPADTDLPPPTRGRRREDQQPESKPLDASASPLSRLLKPVLVTLLALVMASLLFALSLEDEGAATGNLALEANARSTGPELIDRTPALSQQPAQEIEPASAEDTPETMPEAIKAQLDETQRLQQEMASRQQEDRARMQALEEQAAQLKLERDKALARANAETAKREAEAEAARIAAKKQQEAHEMAQRAIAEAMAAERKAKLLEELRAQEEQEKQKLAEAIAEQERLKAVADAAALEQARLVEESKAAQVDKRCTGATARFLSTCR